MFELGERFLVAAGGFRQLQFTEGVVERGYQVFGLRCHIGPDFLPFNASMQDGAERIPGGGVDGVP